MDTRLAERLFVLITSNMDRTYEEECNMAMDVFLEEEFDMGELKRMLLYLLDKVKADRREMVKEKIEQQNMNVMMSREGWKISPLQRCRKWWIRRKALPLYLRRLPAHTV